MNEINYDVRPLDFFRGYTSATARNPIFRIIALSAFIFLFINGLSYCFAEDELSLPFIIAAFFVALLPLVVGLLVMTCFAIYRFFNAKKAGLLCNHMVRLTAEGIECESKAFSGLVRWNGVQSIYSTRNTVVTVLISGGSQIIPMRAFADRSHAHKYVSEAKRYLTADRGD